MFSTPLTSCSIGRATVPTMTITTDSTVAKMGRSMKKCENIGLPPLARGSVACRFGPGAGHGAAFRVDLRSIAHALNPIDDDPVLRLHALANNVQAIAQAAKSEIPAP